MLIFYGIQPTSVIPLRRDPHTRAAQPVAVDVGDVAASPAVAHVGVPALPLRAGPAEPAAQLPPPPSRPGTAGTCPAASSPPRASSVGASAARSYCCCVGSGARRPRFVRLGAHRPLIVLEAPARGNHHGERNRERCADDLHRPDHVYDRPPRARRWPGARVRRPIRRRHSWARPRRAISCGLRGAAPAVCAAEELGHCASRPRSREDGAAPPGPGLPQHVGAVLLGDGRLQVVHHRVALIVAGTGVLTPARPSAHARPAGGMFWLTWKVLSGS